MSPEWIKKFRELLAECEATAENNDGIKNMAWCCAEFIRELLRDVEETESDLPDKRLLAIHRGEVQHPNGLEVPGVPRQDVVVPFRQRGRVQGGVRGGCEELTCPACHRVGFYDGVCDRCGHVEGVCAS